MAFDYNQRREIEDIARRVLGLFALVPPAPGPHSATHEDGGPDEIDLTGLTGLSATPQTPAAHAASHQDGGPDEVNVGGLSGLLADPQTPLAHAASHEDGGGDELDLTGMSGLLATPQTPALHAASHEAGGPDEIDLTGMSGLLATPQTPAAHATSHQNGGADEVNVAALSGRLADPQDTDLAPLAFAMSGDIADTVAALTHNWNPAGLSGASRINVTVTGSDQGVTGLVGGADGRIVVVHVLRASPFSLGLIVENVASTAANRFHLPLTPTGPAYVIGPGESLPLQYDSTTARWTPFSASLPQAHAASHGSLGSDPLDPESVPLTVLETADSQRIVGRGDAGTGPWSAVTFSDTGIAISTGEVLSVSGRLVGITVLASGSGTYSKPAHVTALDVLVMGGGGGGGGAAHAAASSAAAGGGGAGSWCRKRYTSAAASYAYAVGAGGAGGAAGNNPGTAGTNSTFDTMTGVGGTGGAGSPAVTVAASVLGGTSSIATGGDVNAAGQSGFFGLVLAAAGPAIGGQGGSTIWGGGAPARNTQSNGLAGAGPGAGGGGGVTVNGGGPGTTKAGGAGQTGIIVVYEYT